MPRAKAVPAAQFVTGQPADPYADATVTGGDDWRPPAPQVSPTVLKLAEALTRTDKISVDIGGWAQDKVKGFLSEIKRAAKHATGGRQIIVRVGTRAGQPSLLISTKAPRGSAS